MSLTSARLRGAAALVFVALATWWPSFDNGYSLDDYNWLAPAHFKAARAFLASTDGVELWTPVSSLFFFVVDRAFSGQPLAFRVALFACHLVTALLLWALLVLRVLQPLEAPRRVPVPVRGPARRWAEG